MIAGWLCQIGWVARVEKDVAESYLGISYETKIGQSYMITQKGQVNLNSEQKVEQGTVGLQKGFFGICLQQQHRTQTI